MARCEDFPCCGHEAGCCPRYENGVQMDMVCVCGARLPVDNPTSICHHCLKEAEREDGYYDDEASYDESMDGDMESGLASAGFGTDEDYGYYGDDTPMGDYYGGE
jgi:hypothetical protein